MYAFEDLFLSLVLSVNMLMAIISRNSWRSADVAPVVYVLGKDNDDAFIIKSCSSKTILYKHIF